MPQYDNRSNVIPFQVPDIAKTAYEQSYGQRQTERKERAGRRSEAQQETEGIAGNIAMLPPDWSGTTVTQELYDEVMSLGAEYEQNPDVYNEFRTKKEELESLIKQSQGAFTYINKQNQEAANAPFEYTVDEEAKNSFINGKYTDKESLLDALQPENVVNAAYKKRVKPPKYINPLEALDLFSAYTGKGMGDPMKVGDGYKMVYTPQNKADILNSIRTTFMTDPDFRASVILFDKLDGNTSFSSGEVTQEMIQETMKMYASDEKMQQLAIERYYNALLPSMEAKLDSDQYAPKPTKEADTKEPKQPSDTTYPFTEVIQKGGTTLGNGNVEYKMGNIGKPYKARLENKQVGGLEDVEMLPIKVEIDPRTKTAIRVTFAKEGYPNFILTNERAEGYLNDNFPKWKNFYGTEAPKEQQQVKKSGKLSNYK